jgi:hypothetical protein
MFTSGVRKIFTSQNCFLKVFSRNRKIEDKNPKVRVYGPGTIFSIRIKNPRSDTLVCT